MLDEVMHEEPSFTRWFAPGAPVVRARWFFLHALGLIFFSFVAAAQDFSSYQSDVMLLEAAFLSLFLASRDAPSPAAVFLLRYEWFRIYFESGLVKILSGEEQWRSLTAMDKYYENGPLPTFLGWHVQQWPHTFHS